jgi:hypothetical protein
VIERVAMRGSGMASRLAAKTLCRQLRTGNPYREVHSVVRLLCSASDERVRVLARAALERAWEHVLDGRSSVWYGFRLRAKEAGTHGRADLPVEAARFLLAPVSASRFRPAVRVVAAFDGEPRGSLEYCGELLIEAAIHSTDPETRELLGRRLLRTTDHPALLAELDRAFGDALLGFGTAPLWDDDDRPTRLLDLLLDNPHLRRPPPPTDSMGFQKSELAVLAILQNQPDLLRHYEEAQLARELLYVLTKPLPATVAERCRRVLLEFGPGRGREFLCNQAMADDTAVRTVVVEAGHLPAQPHRVPLFLFCTEQWERFDRIDPGGKKLREHRDSYSHDDWHRLKAVAHRTGRPCPPRPAADRIVESRPTRYRPGGTGTSGTGGYTGGGGFGI